MSHQTPLSAEQTFALLQQQQALQTDFARLKPHPLGHLYRLTGCGLMVAMLCWLTPELIKEPVFHPILIATLMLLNELNRDNRKIHQRLEVLQQMLQDKTNR